MKYSYTKFSDDAKKQSLVNAAEAEFERNLDSCVNAVCTVPELKLIRLSGPSCSGKTTVAGKLVREFSERGKTVHVISIDDFYKDNIRLPDNNGKLDFDSINAIDLPEFERCVNNIFEGRPAYVPKFDFTQGRRNGHIEIMPDEDKDLFIFEGIQAIYPEITALLAKHISRGIYICAAEPIDINGTVFEPNEIRLMRRIVRDFNFRGASPDYSMILWEGVRENEDKNIFPYVESCDITINSTMAYEINMLAPFLVPLLSEVPQSSPNYAAAQKMKNKVKELDAVPPVMLPDGSVYYEFIKNEHINKERKTFR